jgi:hypothetical protein
MSPPGPRFQPILDLARYAPLLARLAAVLRTWIFERSPADSANARLHLPEVLAVAPDGACRVRTHLPPLAFARFAAPHSRHVHRVLQTSRPFSYRDCCPWPRIRRDETPHRPAKIRRSPSGPRRVEDPPLIKLAHHQLQNRPQLALDPESFPMPRAVDRRMCSSIP